MIDQMYLMLYNLFFTSLPPLVIGELSFYRIGYTFIDNFVKWIFHSYRRLWSRCTWRASIIPPLPLWQGSTGFSLSALFFLVDNTRCCLSKFSDILFCVLGKRAIFIYLWVLCRGSVPRFLLSGPSCRVYRLFQPTSWNKFGETETFPSVAYKIDYTLFYVRIIWRQKIRWMTRLKF